MEKLNCSVYEISDSFIKLITEDAVVSVYVSGSSMNPFLVSRRDIVYLKRPEEKDITKGSILMFRRNDGSLILHRLKRINPDGTLVMCGDAQLRCESVDRNQVVASVSEVERKGCIKSTKSFYWKSISFIWEILTPFRSLIMRVWYKIRRIRNK